MTVEQVGLLQWTPQSHGRKGRPEITWKSDLDKNVDNRLPIQPTEGGGGNTSRSNNSNSPHVSDTGCQFAEHMLNSLAFPVLAF